MEHQNKDAATSRALGVAADESGDINNSQDEERMGCVSFTIPASTHYITGGRDIYVFTASCPQTDLRSIIHTDRKS